MADDEHSRQAPPLRLKKLYVMGGLLIERYHEQSRQKLAKLKGETSASVIFFYFLMNYFSDLFRQFLKD